MSKEKNKQKVNSSKKYSWFRRMFLGERPELNFLEEEQVQSPLRTIVKRFRSKKISMFGLIVFLIMFLIVIIGPLFFKLDNSYSDTTQQNVAPGLNMQDMPTELKKNGIADIAVGATFCIGVDNNGKIYTWGKTKITNMINISSIPEEVKNTKIVKVAVGIDHAVAMDENGQIYAWGNGRAGQLDIPPELKRVDNVKQIICGYQCTAAVTEDGYIYVWGNTNMNDIKIKKKNEGSIEKVAFTGEALLALSKDGSVLYLGKQKNAYSEIPEGLEAGVVDIAATLYTVSALKEDGQVVTWGSFTKNENKIPEFASKPIELFAGRYHYTAITEKNEIYCWGSDYFKQATVPSKLDGIGIDKVFTGYYQNYVTSSDGNVYSWGLKGYILGTDNLGRDILNRIVNGGKTTMTIGAISVIISTCIGIVVGCVSGYFGGKVDMILQRFTEVISSLPFLPFALMLSAVLGSRVAENQRMMIIMVVLGILSWPPLSRLVRAQVLAEREKEFVTAAKAVGVKERGIVFRHILPNVVNVIIVTATLDFAGCMLIEAILSYLGFGVQPPTPTWGNMLYGCNNSVIIQYNWWRWVFPSIALGICTVCINLIGDGLTDAIDPKSSER